jgi:hypothetical protein
MPSSGKYQPPAIDTDDDDGDTLSAYKPLETPTSPKSPLQSYAAVTARD